MGVSVEAVSGPEASDVANVEEGQFYDVKRIEIRPADLTKTIAAFANADGGDLYVGIAETEVGLKKSREWRGFHDQEAANGHIQCFEGLFPLGQDYHYEFLACQTEPGYVLHIQVNKARGIVKASNSLPYVRRGAQNLPVDTPEKLRQLQYCKGITSFESEPLNIPKEAITSSEPIADFMRVVVPQQEAEKWLRKQLLIVNDRPTVAGVLLYSDEPQAAIPKRCGIKLYRYKTTDPQGFREALAFTPITVEKWLYSQIHEAVERTTEIIESIPKMGEDALEAVRYPAEALHEIITNAVLHRDYSVADDVHIRIFDNRVEVESPGRLPAHVTVENILDERFARNGSVVRILNKFPNPPNKDVGEGLNTAFSAMQQLGLKDPVIRELANSVLVVLRHEKLASPEEAIMDYLAAYPTIKNKKAREITHITADYRIKNIFGEMVKKGMIEQVPGTRTGGTSYRLPRPQDDSQAAD